jgi:hypothetical protein
MDRVFDANREGVVRTARGFASGGIQVMGCVSDGACSIEGITVTAPPSGSEKQIECGPDDSSCNGTGGTRWSNSGGDWTGGGDNGGWTSGGDTDADDDYVDEGPIAFAICVAAALGADGWASLGLTAFAAYELWGARVDVQNTYAMSKRYDEETDPSQWDVHTSHLYYTLWQNAKSSENSLWGALAGAGTISAIAIGKAVAKCIPAAAAPV